MGKVTKKLVFLYLEDSTLIECQNLAAHLRSFNPKIAYAITNKKMDTISRAELKQMVKMLE